ncbi:uncharacterized protein MELLADRAFT_88359 [Melampsora larici-populina 98AG31]|uniref:Uncharacterized protein n=1 Tax=Melampsora larici-populina (strain 98AG31 / pathotype 3-4-7) TaxID=747676 RepID=F4RRF5_MELLP|nr:uncharacterized protein MELLADRAFT_88359 [Melampsora larici-populina 98AG31]EGG04928.1 hypothetical protein MELLADRAFT_88359 [Melampsora larici-populina 98AG31]
MKTGEEERVLQDESRVAGQRSLDPFEFLVGYADGGCGCQKAKEGGATILEVGCSGRTRCITRHYEEAMSEGVYLKVYSVGLFWMVFPKQAYYARNISYLTLRVNLRNETAISL